MAKYIVQESAVKLAEKYGLANGSVLGRHTGLADCIASEIASLPVADVAPVVHGRWLKPHWALGRQRVCSVCHNTVRMPSFDSGEYAEYPGCPWCLAKMDGGAE